MKVMRKIINIDEEKCNGCGQCVEACHEGAIQMIDGKAKLVRDDYCDGLGDCIGECPQDAITFEERMAEPFDEEAVEQQMAEEEIQDDDNTLECGCPGTAVQELEGEDHESTEASASIGPSQLRNWPVQIHLVPPSAEYLEGADLLIAADCTAFAIPDFHERYLRGRVALVGCPKLDDIERYRQKLADIFANNDIRSLEVLRMQVPCCGGLPEVVRQALEDAGAAIPAGATTISSQGEKLDRSLIIAEDEEA